jgi:signal transduction histidine kinase
MENLRTRNDQKLSMIIQHAPMGLAEIDRNGDIIHLNIKGEAQLKPVLIATDTNAKNLFPLLEKIAPAVADKIKSSPDDAGHILTNELHTFFLSLGGEKIERHFTFTVIKMFTDCIIVGFDDITQKLQKERAIQQLISDRAVMQGKFEIASNILHDIGNAVVGFGSYMNRIRRSLDQNNPENLHKLATFFSSQQTAMSPILGEAKAGAVISMLNNMSESQKNTHDEMRKSLSEQHNIITHIQDILNIQRQYASGNDTVEKRPTKLRAIVDDCMSMLLASIEKRGIVVTLNIPEGLPLIKGERTRLMQVILNIIKNSIEAIDITASEKNITLSATATDSFLVLEIKDNGHGFDGATGLQLFQRGFTTKASGSGLGLDSCRAIIESHEGSIDMCSEGFGKGAFTTIKFKI